MGKVLGFGLAAWLLATAPAWAQFGGPFGGAYGSPGLYAAPEGATGAIGAGAGNSAATQQQCTTTPPVGRGGPQTVCTYGRPGPSSSNR